ncbi:hypothetical protein [Winogradskyella sp.]
MVHFLKMTIKELSNKLKEPGISDDRFYLHGLFGSTEVSTT